MLRSLGFGLGLETFAKFFMISVSVSKNLVSEKKYRFRFRNFCQIFEGFGFGKFGLGKKVLVSVSENLVSEKKVSVSVSENLVSEKESRYRYRSNFWYRHSVARGASMGSHETIRLV